MPSGSCASDALAQAPFTWSLATCLNPPSSIFHFSPVELKGRGVRNPKQSSGLAHCPTKHSCDFRQAQATLRFPLCQMQKWPPTQGNNRQSEVPGTSPSFLDCHGMILVKHLSWGLVFFCQKIPRLLLFYPSASVLGSLCASYLKSQMSLPPGHQVFHKAYLSLLYGILSLKTSLHRLTLPAAILFLPKTRSKAIRVPWVKPVTFGPRAFYRLSLLHSPQPCV